MKTVTFVRANKLSDQGTSLNRSQCLAARRSTAPRPILKVAYRPFDALAGPISLKLGTEPVKSIKYHTVIAQTWPSSTIIKHDTYAELCMYDITRENNDAKSRKLCMVINR